MPQLITSNSNKLQNLAEQLRCPKGKEGQDLAKIMNVTNKGMIASSLEALSLKPQLRILEIGPGSCAHLSSIMKKEKGLRYFGLEISATMVKEAIKNNTAYINRRKALFQLYNGYTVPYVHNFFDRIMTVNTVYFWEQPKDFLVEMHRVLKPDGICVITFANGDFMEKLPFVNSTFQLYSTERIKDLVGQTKFELSSFQTKEERVVSKDGSLVNRKYTVMVLKKAPKKVKEDNE